MKNIRFILLGIFVVLALIVGAYFIHNSKADAYMNSIPADAIAIGRIDMVQFVRDAKLSTVEHLQMLRQVTASSDADQVGINTELPIYAFLTPQHTFGIVASVRHADNLATQLHTLCEDGRCTQPEEYRGYLWTTFFGRYLFACNDHKAMVMGPSVNTIESLRPLMLQLLEQPATASAVITPIFKELLQDESHAALVANCDIIPEAVRAMYASMTDVNIGDPNDILIHCSLRAKANRLELDADLVTSSDKIRERIKSLNDFFRPIQGNLLDRATAEPFLALGCNIQGESLLRTLRKDNTLRTAMVMSGTVFDIDKTLRAIDGDILLQADSCSVTSAHLVAQLSNTDFLQDAPYWLTHSGGNLHRVDAQSYAIRLWRDYLLFGVKDSCLYAHAPQSQVSLLRYDMQGKGDPYLTSQRKDIRGTRLYLTMDLRPLWVNLAGAQTTFGPLISLAANFQRLDLWMNKTDDLHLEMSASKDVNIAKSILLNR